MGRLTGTRRSISILLSYTVHYLLTRYFVLVALIYATCRTKERAGGRGWGDGEGEWEVWRGGGVEELETGETKVDGIN